MPAEWEKQEAVWIAWPHNELTWDKMLLPEVENSYVEFAKALHKGQKVKILVNDSASEQRARAKLSAAGVNSNVLFFSIKNQDAWIRDYGPTFVVNGRAGQKAMVKWTFNAWGNKYEDLLADNKIPFEMNRKLKMLLFETKINLEGGSIEANGTGTLLTTTQCLLNKNRNPSLTKTQIEQCLKDYLDVSNILWLREGIAGDDTDGHIDDIARFVSQNTVVCAFEGNTKDANHEILRENYELLRKMKDEDGNKIKVVKLPMPSPVNIKNARLPASYTNFYIGNEAVAVPVFGDKNDKAALKILQKLVPSRKVVGINCRAMVYGLGTLHCCSQQEPCV